MSALLDANAPAERRGIERDAVRLLVTDKRTGATRHAAFRDLPSVLQTGDVLVVNDSATLAARLIARRSNGATLPLHLSTHVGGELWTAEPRETVTAGDVLQLASGATATMLAQADAGGRYWYVRLHVAGGWEHFLRAHGEPVRYAYVSQRYPLADYQTVFARRAGSAEMPSAARPFTLRVVYDLLRRGIDIVPITLHTGLSTAEAHEGPQPEWFCVPARAARSINAARRDGRRIIAVGTTSTRALESAEDGGEAVAANGWTDLLVTPQRPPRLTDGILSGFHDVTASHMSMLEAFAGKDALHAAYAQAAAHGYRRHEFGDVHLIA